MKEKLEFLAQLDSPADVSEAQWRSLGFQEPARLQQGLATLSARPDTQAPLTQHWRAVIAGLSESCDPDAAFAGLQRYLEAGGAAGGGVSQWFDAPLLEVLCKLFAATPALSAYLIRWPSRTAPILEPVLLRQIMAGNSWRELLRQRLGKADSYPGELAALRRVRIESMLQIAAVDLLGISSFFDTVRALSDLADACVQAALELAVKRLRPRMGEIISPARAAAPGTSVNPPFVVFALGKLGGRELNYSSDIDLVFAYRAQGETSGVARPVEASVYFTALGEELIAALDKVTDDGRAYRVDMRLRPHGGAGPLASDAGQMLNYFQTEGRTWERQAWLKARAIAGDTQSGAELLAHLAPFIYRRYLSLEAIGDMQALKRQIELGVARRGETQDEVKLGKGGLRDIEFTVQFLQLLHGSEHPAVRGGNTLRALDDLRRAGLLGGDEADALHAAYVFLRQVEHRLQLHGDQQVHRVPSDPAARRRLAKSLEYGDGGHSAQDAFETARTAHTARTREIFQHLFANLFRESSGPDGELCDLLLAPEPDLPRIAALFPRFGFADTASSAAELVDLSRETLILSSPSRTRKFFASIAPQLLKALAATGEPDDALRRFSRITASLGAKSVFFQMLNENPWLLKMTAELAAWSQYLTDILIANPGLFDELVDALQVGRSKTAQEMSAELAHIAAGGDIADTLRAYRAGELLRIGVRDLIHRAGLEQTQAELSDLAEAVLNTQVQHNLKSFAQTAGEIHSADGLSIGFAMLALGKFGGREMNYGSDLDVIYFYGADGQTADGLPAVTYFAQLAQELTRAMATPTALGPLYSLDARLRPNGNKGPLALSPEDFRRYWKEGQLMDWERLALTRARFVAGDAGVGERALHLLRSAVYSPLKDTGALAAEVRGMRARLEETADGEDLKRGRGGLVDIEFTAQYLQLIHGPAFPPLRHANTEEALKALVKFNKLTRADGEALLQAYYFLQRMENRVRVVHGLSAHNLPAKAGALRKLAMRADYTDTAGQSAEARLRDDYLRHREKVREIFERVVS